jgi:septal ring factor EnvC (AmiA/AmiB activator)
LRAQLQELAALRSVQDGALAQLSAALDRVQEARTQLSQAIAERRMLPENFIRDEAAMEELLGSVDSLDALSELLAQTPPDSLPDLPDFADARGGLPLPVLGTLLRSYGEADAAGVTRPGLVYATRPNALVTAPWPASVRYAGPLLDYGNVIILEPEGGYLLVLAGLGALYVGAGGLVSSGTAVGLMPGGAEAPDEELLASPSQGSGGGLTETLYIEVRETGAPVDPAEWFTETGRD